MLSRSHAPKRGPSLSILGLALLGLTSSPPATAQVAVTTQNYDNRRSGANTAETVLKPANVNQTTFGKLFTITGLDAPVGGQALYVPGVVINGVSRNVLYVYQVNDRDNSPCGLSAYDADSGVNLWHMALPASAEYTTATPVIDAQAGILYLITKTGTDATGATFLHAVNIQTGAEEPGSPLQVQASVTGTGDGTLNGAVNFDGPSTGSNRFHANDRPALLLLNGTVYAAFAHNTDSFPYHGWVLAYKYNGTALMQTAKFCTTPNGSDGGIWMSGKGLTADSAGNIYCSVGNGTFDANTKGITIGTDYGMCYLKLSPTLQVLDWFSPHDEGGFSQSDLDTGNSGLVGIPGTTSLFGGGTKFGSGFLLNSSNMGGFTTGGPDRVLARIDGLSSNGNNGQNPIAWDTGSLKYVYLWPKTQGTSTPTGSLMQFAYDPSVGGFSPAGIFKQNTALTSGGPLTVSSNAGSNGILWAVGNNSVVHALNASDVTQPDLCNSGQNSTRDALGSVGKWQFPIVTNGKVYVPTGSTTIAVYGLLPVAVTGTVALQGQPSGSAAPSLTFTFTPTGTTGGGTFVRTVAPTGGAFSVPTVPAGTYTLGIKGSKWLRQDQPIDTTGGAVTGLSFSLLAGDLNGDNQVDINDFIVLRAAYNSTPASANWNPNADLNGDGQVDINDFIILRSNFNDVGNP